MRLCKYMKHKKEMFNASLKKRRLASLSTTRNQNRKKYKEKNLKTHTNVCNNNNNNNNNNQDDIYGAVIMASHCESSPDSFDECSAVWPDQANQLAVRTASPPEKAATVPIHHRHLLLLSPRADIHFTVPRRVEG